MRKDALVRRWYVAFQASDSQRALKFSSDHGNSTQPWHDFTNIKAKPFSPPMDSRSPRGRAAATADEAVAAARELAGEVVIKIQPGPRGAPESVRTSSMP